MLLLCDFVSHWSSKDTAVADECPTPPVHRLPSASASPRSPSDRVPNTQNQLSILRAHFFSDSRLHSQSFAPNVATATGTSWPRPCRRGTAPQHDAGPCMQHADPLSGVGRCSLPFGCERLQLRHCATRDARDRVHSGRCCRRCCNGSPCWYPRSRPVPHPRRSFLHADPGRYGSRNMEDRKSDGRRW